MSTVRSSHMHLLLALCAGTCVPVAHAQYEDGLKPIQLAAMTRLLPSAPIYEVLFLHEDRGPKLSGAFLTADRHGWQITITSPRTRGYSVSWQSHALEGSFAVSSPNNFKTYDLDGGQAVSFSGCAAHMCPDIFSVLLYVPSAHASFIGSCRDKSTTYSFKVSPENLSYKHALDELLHGMSGREQACASEIQ